MLPAGFSGGGTHAAECSRSVHQGSLPLLPACHILPIAVPCLFPLHTSLLPLVPPRLPSCVCGHSGALCTRPVSSPWPSSVRTRHATCSRHNRLRPTFSCTMPLFPYATAAPHDWCPQPQATDCLSPESNSFSATPWCFPSHLVVSHCACRVPPLAMPFKPRSASSTYMHLRYPCSTHDTHGSHAVTSYVLHDALDIATSSLQSERL